MNGDDLPITRSLILIGIALAVLFLISGCQERFRYPCQDPSNWEAARCQRPQCAITQECPDQLVKPDDMKGDVR